MKALTLIQGLLTLSDMQEIVSVLMRLKEKINELGE